MTEHINNTTGWLTSGGHVWIWATQSVKRTVLQTTALQGAYGFVTAHGRREGRIAGDPGPALMVASGGDKAACDAALNSYESAIETLIKNGTEVPWQDDQGHSGSALVVTGYRRMGRRKYNMSKTSVWQWYVLTVEEMAGGGGSF